MEDLTLRFDIMVFWLFFEYTVEQIAKELNADINEVTDVVLDHIAYQSTFTNWQDTQKL